MGSYSSPIFSTEEESMINWVCANEEVDATCDPIEISDVIPIPDEHAIVDNDHLVQLPLPSMTIEGDDTEESSLEEIEQTTYEVLKGVSTRASNKLFDSNGYSYSLLRTNKDGSKVWRCRIRGKDSFCTAIVKESTSAVFTKGLHSHNHPAQIGTKESALINKLTKDSATKDPFPSAHQVAREVLRDILPRGRVLKDLRSIKNFAKNANNARNKLRQQELHQVVSRVAEESCLPEDIRRRKRVPTTAALHKAVSRVVEESCLPEDFRRRKRVPTTAALHKAVSGTMEESCLPEDFRRRKRVPTTAALHKVVSRAAEESCLPEDFRRRKRVLTTAAVHKAVSRMVEESCLPEDLRRRKRVPTTAAPLHKAVSRTVEESCLPEDFRRRKRVPTTAALRKVVSRAAPAVPLADPVIPEQRAAPAAPLADPVIPEHYRIYEVQPGKAEYEIKSIRSSIRMLYTSNYFSDSSDSDVEDEKKIRPIKPVAIAVDDCNFSEADSSKGNNSSERASDTLEKLLDSDSSEDYSSKGSNSSERASSDLEKISEAKKRRKNNDNDGKNGDGMDKTSDGKVKKYAKASDILELEKICLVCGTGENIAAKHPLFIGGLCKEHMLLCHEKFFEYESNGYNSSCCICSMGTKLVICDKLDCGKSYCRDCLTRFIDSGVYNNAAKSKNWMCNFCENSKEGFLRKRAGWQKEIQILYKNIVPRFPSFPIQPTVPKHERKPIRVLSLFDGISTGAVALKQLGIEIEKFVASEIDEDAVRLVKNKHPEVIHIGDITKLSNEKVYDMGPFDLVLGGSPCNDLSRVNPKRKGLLDVDGTGCLFFDYYRILRTIEPPRTNDLRSKRPFFWLFENVTSMKEIEKQRISRFLQCKPRTADARYVSAACRSRLFWGNLPGLMDKELTPGVNDRLTVQECLESGRKARFEKLNTITSKYLSLYQGPQNRAPVVHDGEEDVLWTTEVERVFGVPEHYTDVNNLGSRERVALLGKSWSVPVIRQLLSPLRDYFKCNLD